MSAPHFNSSMELFDNSHPDPSDHKTWSEHEMEEKLSISRMSLSLELPQIHATSPPTDITCGEIDIGGLPPDDFETIQEILKEID